MPFRGPGAEGYGHGEAGQDHPAPANPVGEPAPERDGHDLQGGGGGDRPRRSPHERHPIHPNRSTKHTGARAGTTRPTDARSAERIGLHRPDVDALGTRYVCPQENGARADVRWAELDDGVTSVRIEGNPA